MLFPVAFLCAGFWTSADSFSVHVQLTRCTRTSHLRIIRFYPELGNVSSSVTSAAVCTITVTDGETSDVRQTVKPPNRGFILLTDCPYNIELGRPCYLESVATGLAKKARYIGSISTCLLQECTLFGVNKHLSVTIMQVIWGQ